MKRILLCAITLLILNTGGVAKGTFQVSIGFNTFYTSLSPYGEWLESDFGYAWRPVGVMHGWRPYLHGRWAWTSYGWYWVSSEPFGWATFHYGRWYYDDYYGWIWIPDYDWGPGWVEWCYNDNYIGWAPLSPYAHFSINIGITIINQWITPVHYWNFTHGRHFTSSRIHTYIEPMEYNRRIIGDTRRGGSIRSVDDRIVNNGIDINRVERQTNSRIRRVDVIERERGQQERIVRDRGQDRIEAYRPRIERNSSDKELRPPVVSQEKRGRSTGTEPRVRDTDRQRTPSAVTPERNIDRRQERAIPRSSDDNMQRRSTDMRQNPEVQRQESQQRQEKQRETIEKQRTEQRKQIENRTRQMPRYERVEPPKRDTRKPAIQERPQKPPRQSEPRSGRRP